jgi:hypothetical protein
MTGSFSAQGDVVTLQLQTSGQDPTQEPSQTQAQLNVRQFVGDTQNSNGMVMFTMDVSTATPLTITFALDLTVDAQGNVSGTGAASSCGVQVPVNVTGNNGPSSCALHIVGSNLPQFTWDGSGPPIATGFVASWSANGFGATRSGAQLPIFAPNAPPLSAYVISRKRHGATDVRDFGFVAGSSAVESRPGSEHELVVRFAKNVTLAGVSVNPFYVKVGQYYVVANEVTIDLTGVGNAIRPTVTLVNVSDGTNTANVAVPIGFLLGDITGNGVVNSADVSQLKSQLGAALTATNFRSDVNLNGAINSSDLSIVKSKSGTALP